MRLLSTYIVIFFSVFSHSLWAQQDSKNSLNKLFIAADSERVQQVETFKFKNQNEQQRAIKLARELRCPQCQNQNLIESNSPIAKDLRLEVYIMVNDGKSDQQIIDFMTLRFGDYVLYKPKLNPQTYILWGAPIVLLLLFSWFAFRNLKKLIK
ncbi:MAG: heme lyase NrfEFG subunit NrfF [Psychromonas sp.]